MRPGAWRQDLLLTTPSRESMRRLQRTVEVNEEGVTVFTGPNTMSRKAFFKFFQYRKSGESEQRYCAPAPSEASTGGIGVSSQSPPAVLAAGGLPAGPARTAVLRTNPHADPEGHVLRSSGPESGHLSRPHCGTARTPRPVRSSGCPVPVSSSWTVSTLPRVCPSQARVDS